MIQYMARFWRERGWDVHFHDNLLPLPFADVAVLHVDASLVEDRYLTLVNASKVVLNRKATNIRKDFYSAQMLSRDSSYSGPVIVKTIENCGGLPERSRKETSSLQWALRKLNTAVIRSRLLPPALNSRAWERVESWDPLLYPTFESIESVPHGVWNNPHLMVEKLLSERGADGRYLLRHWYFFGDKEFGRLLSAPHPVVKWCNMTEQDRQASREEWLHIAQSDSADIPDAVRSVRTRLGLDFGRIDWAILEGGPVVYDVNKTPGGLTSIDFSSEIDEARERALRRLSEGLLSYL